MGDKLDQGKVENVDLKNGHNCECSNKEPIDGNVRWFDHEQ